MTWEDDQAKISEAMSNVLRIATEAYEGLFSATAESRRLREVARALCEAGGYEPDMMVMGSPNPRGGPMWAAKGTTPVQNLQPQWTLFIVDAKAAIEVVERTAQPT